MNAETQDQPVNVATPETKGGSAATLGSALLTICAEVDRATEKFPLWPDDPLHALAVLGEEYGELTLDSDEDICGLCGKPGADKYAHPCHWPGEQVPDGPLVHAECEQEECRRAHSLLTDKQRENFLRNL